MLKICHLCFFFVKFEVFEKFFELSKDKIGVFISHRLNAAKMADKIIELLNDTDKLKEMGKNAYNSAKKYTKKAVIKTWEQLLDETKEK